jgi:hypothetical protein
LCLNKDHKEWKTKKNLKKIHIVTKVNSQNQSFNSAKLISL